MVRQVSGFEICPVSDPVASGGSPSVRLGCSEVDAKRPELCGARLLRCTREHIGTPGDLESLEARRFDCRLELCFQQSAGDSALPEIDVALGGVGHGLLHEDVADLKAAARS